MPTQLVSVGIPTYNRPKGLQATLKCMTEQSHRHLEILVSDNNSTDPAVESVLKDFEAADQRVSVVRQPVNMGPFANFRCLIDKARGGFFMWAADDDRWDSDYIATLVDVLQSEPSTTVAAATEACYFLDDGTQCDFFPEGSAFYEFASDSPEARVEHMLRYVYGNLLYGMFRLEILRSFEPVLAENEIPFLLQVSVRGNWKVIPKVGLHKRTTHVAYREARWERLGGVMRPRATRPRSMLAAVDYHRRAGQLTRSVLLSLGLSGSTTRKLLRTARSIFRRHLIELSVGLKFRRA